MSDARTYQEALESLRTVSDTELAVTLMLVSRVNERNTGERIAAAEAAAERLLDRPTETAPGTQTPENLPKTQNGPHPGAAK